jgi:hypothetical protein
MDIKIFATFAGHLPALAFLPGFGHVGSDMTKISECIQVVVTHQVDTATVTAVTTVRAAPGNIFFATKMDHAVTAVACNGLDCYFINESHIYLVYKTLSTQRREGAKVAKNILLLTLI